MPSLNELGKNNKLAKNDQQSKNNLASLDSVLTKAESSREDVVDKIADRLVELGDPEQILKDAIAKAQQTLSNAPTTTLDAVCVALEDYDPLAVLTGDIASFLPLSGTTSQPLLLNGKSALDD